MIEPPRKPSPKPKAKVYRYSEKDLKENPALRVGGGHRPNIVSKMPDGTVRVIYGTGTE